MLLTLGRPEPGFDHVRYFAHDKWVLQRCRKPRLFWQPYYTTPGGRWLRCVDYNVYSLDYQPMYASFILSWVIDLRFGNYVHSHQTGRPTPVTALLRVRHPRILTLASVLIQQNEEEPPQ